VLIFVAALGAAESKVGALEGIGHTACRYAECLHHKGPEDKGEYEGSYQPFEGVGDFSRPVLLFMMSLVGILFFFALGRRHKYAFRQIVGLGLSVSKRLIKHWGRPFAQQIRRSPNAPDESYKSAGKYRRGNYADKPSAGQQGILSCGQPACCVCVVNNPLNGQENCGDADFCRTFGTAKRTIPAHCGEPVPHKVWSRPPTRRRAGSMLAFL
jgi:hypothetical protein